MEFSKAKMKEMIKNQTSKRVSEESAVKFGEVIEQYAGDISEAAIAEANEEGRKTVRAEDIRESLR